MGKKQKARAKSEHMRRRIMRRRITLVVGTTLVLGTLFAELFISLLAQKPEWLGSPAYYGLVLAGFIIGFALLFLWNETSDKTEIDELEERMEQLFLKQTQSIDRLTKEIRKERKMWSAKFKQG